MRVGYHSPLPPDRSGIASYSALLVPALRQHVALELVERSTRSASFDLSLYHLGNDVRWHGWIFAALRHRPGVVVLHEVALHELIASLTLGRGNRSAYLAAVEREGGRRARDLGLAALAGLSPPLWETHPLELPLLTQVLENATGVVVHSSFAEGAVRAQGYEGPVRQVPFPVARGAALPATLPGEPYPVVASLGAITAAKRIPQLLAAFALLRRRFPRALLVLAGYEGEAEIQLQARAAQLGLRTGRDVLAAGAVNDNIFSSLIVRSDVCVGLRCPTLGETSAAVMDALARGRAVIVSDVGSYRELPASVAVKVPVDAYEVDLLAASLELLAADDDLRAAMGRAAAEYIATYHGPERAAAAYAAAFDDVDAAAVSAAPRRGASA